MVGRRGFPLLIVLATLDAVATTAALACAYRLRFSPWFPIEADKGIPDWGEYIRAVPVVVILALLANRWCRLYHPEELSSLMAEGWAIAKSSILAGILIAAASFFYREFEYSRLTLLLLTTVNIPFVLGMRILLRFSIQALKLRRLVERNCLIIGVGRQAQAIFDRLRESPYSQFRPVAFMDLATATDKTELRGLPVLPNPEDGVGDVLRRQGIEMVIAAVSYRRYDELHALLDRLTRETPDVVLAPDDFGLLVLRSRAFEYQGLPMISLLETPLSGPDRFIKRAFDLIASAFFLVILSPLMLLIALAVKLTSRGPILYRQERMGMDGRVFRMIKFRTMRVDAESETGPKWATPDDDRRTRLGSLLRRTSLDELPQLLNVLTGDMSLVGPRPERPVFITEFREKVPNYMLRHRIKAGLTGWAQVHGWRGDTSLRKRLQYDLYYVRNWSLRLDLRIMLMTCLRGFSDRNAY